VDVNQKCRQEVLSLSSLFWDQNENFFWNFGFIIWYLSKAKQTDAFNWLDIFEAFTNCSDGRMMLKSMKTWKNLAEYPVQ